MRYGQSYKIALLMACFLWITALCNLNLQLFGSQ